MDRKPSNAPSLRIIVVNSNVDSADDPKISDVTLPMPSSPRGLAVGGAVSRLDAILAERRLAVSPYDGSIRANDSDPEIPVHLAPGASRRSFNSVNSRAMQDSDPNFSRSLSHALSGNSLKTDAMLTEEGGAMKRIKSQVSRNNR
jgi:hypothetical protein